MHHFHYRDGVLHAEDVPLPAIAESVGTPFYCYSSATLRHHFQVFQAPFRHRDHLIAFSAKANSNLAVLHLLGREGSGLDIVSRGEMARGLAAGIPSERMVFSGVGKRRDELEAALDAGILAFNVESVGELELLDAVAAARGQPAPVSLRVNPDVDPLTHPYIATGLRATKFGVSIGEARDLYGRAAAMPGIEVVGVDCHIGSQLTSVAPFVEALQRLQALMVALAEDGHAIHHLDLGGGLGISYLDEAPPHPEDFGRAINEQLGYWPGKLIFEPGRVIAGNAGIFVSEVLYTKEQPDKRFAVVDGAMNDLMRPALYGAEQEIKPVREGGGDTEVVDVVGPICETGDFLGKDRHLPRLGRGDQLAVMSAGAYGATMASNYNTRPRAPEVLVHGDRFEVVRRRETVAELYAPELIPDADWFEAG
ncbi:diaminopimelate decarboxylase [Thiohalorhabdus methylotrophus]|uniref:Diaminopimelate decarboxylase n=1 Tax=Thiohalorhabdus methylotrophus TaxID=3242694 RepID=A0ABV4TWX2_9GAMM